MTTTDRAIRRILKKTSKMASQTNGWFFHWVGAGKLFKTQFFHPRRGWHGSSRPLPSCLLITPTTVRNRLLSDDGENFILN